jgi:hypothetical protein
MERKEMFDALMALYGYKTKRQLAKRIGVRENVLGNWCSRNTMDIEKVANALPEVSPEWLITGKGPMLRLDDKAFADLAKEIEEIKERIRILESK